MDRIRLKNKAIASEIIAITTLEGDEIYALHILYRDAETGRIKYEIEGFKSLADKVNRERELRKYEQLS